MKIKFTLIDDNGKEFSGELDLTSDTSKPTKIEIPKERSYSGLKGGIEFLTDEKFLDNIRTAKEIQEELKKENYFYPIESVDRRLRFLVTKKILARTKEDKVWKYAVRK